MPDKNSWASSPPSRKSIDFLENCAAILAVPYIGESDVDEDDDLHSALQRLLR
jgi:hypothetical protein